MILYTTTSVIGEPSERAFLEFMKEVYLPTLAQDELVEEGSLRLHRILPQGEDVDGISYALHFYTPTEYHLQDVLSNTGLRLAEALVARFGEAVIGFSTIMKEV